MMNENSGQKYYLARQDWQRLNISYVYYKHNLLSGRQGGVGERGSILSMDGSVPDVHKFMVKIQRKANAWVFSNWGLNGSKWENICINSSFPSIWWWEVKWSHPVMSDSAIPWTVDYQDPPSMGFSRQEYYL